MVMKIDRKGLCLLLGAILLALALAGMLLWQWQICDAREKAEGYVTALRQLTPQAQGAMPEARSNNTMPVLSLEGVDFAGILEMPRFGSALPVGAKWGKISSYPCCYFGSVYDGTLQLGATTQEGQYDFYREICVGDMVYFTDLEGNRYGYTVTAMRYAQHAAQTALQREEADLTLFVKNVYAFEYLIIFCNAM